MSEKENINNIIKDININISSEENSKSRNRLQNEKANINSIINNEPGNISIFEEEDGYNSFVYNKSLSKDLIFFNEQNNIINYSSKSLDLISHKLIKNNKNLREDINTFNNLVKMKSNLNFSFESKIEDNILLKTTFNTINNKENNYNFIKNINIFKSLHKKILKNENIINNKQTNINNNNYNKNNIKSKFLKKSKKKNNFKKIEKNIIHTHNRNSSEIYIDLHNSKNKVIKFENILEKRNNNNDLNKTIPNKINFKMYDAYIMSSDFDNYLTDKEKEDFFKDNNIVNKSMRKINISINEDKNIINENIVNENIKINKPKLKNNSINYICTDNMNSNNTKIKNIINNYKNKGKRKKIILNSNYINKLKNKGCLDKNKIITKRIILEEKYMISPQGDKKLVSIKRYEKDKYNNENDINNENINNYDNSHLIQKYYKKIKNSNIINNNKNKPPITYRHSMNNSLFSSIFKENSRQTEHNRIYLKSIDEDSQIISHISYYKNNNINNNNSHYNNINVEFPSNIICKNPQIKNRNIRNINNINNKISKEKGHSQNINSELTNREINLKKKLFYNKICLMKDNNINKFNRSNNNKTENSINNISFHTNFLNSNRTSMNYLQEKEKYKIEPNKSIYERISFTKKQPFMLYHNENPNQNLVINNNKNCPNLVNIVFVNNEEKNKSKYFNKNKRDIPQPRQHKMSCRLKRSNFRFHEIKSMSIGNFSNIRSTRNYNRSGSNKLMNINYNNSNYDLQNNDNFNIYSSMDALNNNDNYNFNDIRDSKYYEICDYDTSRNKSIKYNFDNNVRNRGISEYFVKYIN